MRPLLLLLLAATLGACGFHLRGSQPLPPLAVSPLALVSTAGELNRYLEDGIRRAGGQLDPQADLALHVLAERINRQTSTLDSRAKAAEYTLLYEVDFQLRHASGQPATDARQVLLRRTYQFDNTRIVGKLEEENLLLAQLRQQAAGQIVTQLTRLRREDLAADRTP